MAAQIKEDNRASLKSNSPNRASIISTGRGGAGNMNTDTTSAAFAPPTLSSLATPTIKTEHYTTGRGGTGNMSYNHPSAPEMARASQDVYAPPAVSSGAGDNEMVRVGRGGAANVARADGAGTGEGVVVGVVAGAGREKEEEGRGREAAERRPSVGWAERGREFLRGLSRGRDGK